MGGKLAKANWPADLKHPEVKGVFVGGCVARGIGSRFRAKAHSHTHGAHQGWICFLSHKRLDSRELCLHELAHIVTREGHTKRWRAYLLQIGGTLDEVPGVLKSYHAKVRKNTTHAQGETHGNRTDRDDHQAAQAPETRQAHHS